MKTKALCALLVPALAAGGYFAGPQILKSAGNLPSPSLQQAAVVALAVAASALPAEDSRAATASKTGSFELQAAVDRGWIGVEFQGNGRERMRAALVNKTAASLVVKIPAGQMFENPLNSVLAVRAAEVTLTPKGSTEIVLETAATRSANKVGETAYHLSRGAMPQLGELLVFATDHPELSIPAIQTAVLALTENLPLHTVAKFAPASGYLPSRFDTSAFRVETLEIIRALTALRETGAKDEEIAMTIDPQLKIEAMIEPQTRLAAMKYYGLAPQAEWAYWKNELLAGDARTRHYALFGIARFYPEVALEMLPKWAREAQTNNVFRLTAIQALAETQRAEALPVLRQLTDELGRNTEFGRAAANAAQFLDVQLSKVAASRGAVAFR